jgi:hypothetical protein
MKKQIIGSIEKVDVLGRKGVPVKIDTGADSSAIWASHIRVGRDGILRFRLFGEGSPYYTGKVIKRKNFKVASIRSSTGRGQIRYRAHFAITIGGRRIRALLNLSNRSTNVYKILIGRRTISNKFVVDVTKKAALLPKQKNSTGVPIAKLNKKLQKDPYGFHKKYVKNKGKPKKKGAKK